MGYNSKQYDAALDFLPAADDNIPNVEDQRRIQAYDLYENLWINSTVALKLVMRGDDQSPMLVPSGKKIIESTHRFLAKNFQFFVDSGGNEGIRELTDTWFQTFWKRESVVAKFTSNKRWALVRADAIFLLYANEGKVPGERISVRELDPRQYFEIENPNDENDIIGCHIVEKIQDFREPDKPDKKIARRRTFRKIFDESGATVGISSELTHWEIGKWDDRDPVNAAKMESVPSDMDEPAFMLPDSITALPVYKWRNSPPQNSTWGRSQLTGLETLFYGINQSLSDEDATIVFQGLGMYVTTSGPPRDPNTGEVTDWNIGPKQIIEIGQDQKFDRVTGITDVSPFGDHMDRMEKGAMEASGTPEVALGRVDVTVAESGISLQLQLMPLLAQNEEKELEIITEMDHMLHDITTMWLPAYEPEYFPSALDMQEISVVAIFDDPMPVNRDSKIQELVLLDSSNLILKTMTIAELRNLGYKYPTVSPEGNPLTDEDIAAMLLSQSAALAAAQDPFALGFGTDDGSGGQDQGNTPDQQTVDLGTT